MELSQPRPTKLTTAILRAAELIKQCPGTISDCAACWLEREIAHILQITEDECAQARNLPNLQAEVDRLKHVQQALEDESILRATVEGNMNKMHDTIEELGRKARKLAEQLAEKEQKYRQVRAMLDEVIREKQQLRLSRRRNKGKRKRATKRTAKRSPRPLSS